MRIGVSKGMKFIFGWDHVLLSIQRILETEVGSHIRRKLYGADFDAILDDPQNEIILVKSYAAIADALSPRVIDGIQYGEPGFQLTTIGINAATAGKVGFKVAGNYYENGHLGDYSKVERREISQTISLALAA